LFNGDFHGVQDMSAGHKEQERSPAPGRIGTPRLSVPWIVLDTRCDSVLLWSLL